MTFGIRAVDAFTLEASVGGTLVRQAESWEGLPERLLRASLRDGLRSLKAEAERQAGAAEAA